MKYPLSPWMIEILEKEEKKTEKIVVEFVEYIEFPKKATVEELVRYHPAFAQHVPDTTVATPTPTNYPPSRRTIRLKNRPLFTEKKMTDDTKTKQQPLKPSVLAHDTNTNTKELVVKDKSITEEAAEKEEVIITPPGLNKRRCRSGTKNCKAASDDQNKKKKKIKINIALPDPPPGLPAEFRERIEEIGGTDVVLVIQKALFETDVKQQENRLSIPLKQVTKGTEFLTPQEKRKLNLKTQQKNISVKLIEPNLKDESSLNFTKWEMTNSAMYVLNKKWYSVCCKNGLKENMIVQLWSFRADAELCFALVTV